MIKFLITTTLLCICISWCTGQVSIVGTATPTHDWTTAHLMFPGDTAGLYMTSIFLTNGEVKFVRELVPDSIGGTSFPEGTGQVNGPGIFITASGFYNITFDSLTLEYSFSSGFVGINTSNPTSTLTVQGGFSMTGLIIPFDAGPVSIPNNVSFVTVTGTATDTILSLLPFSYISGLRLVVENASNQPLKVTSNFQSYTVVPVMGAVEFIKSSGLGWTPVGRSVEIPASWLLRGNANTHPDSNFIGTTDSMKLSFRTDSIERLVISANGRVGIGINNPDAFLAQLDVNSNTDHVLRLNTMNNSNPGDKTAMYFYSDNIIRGEISYLMEQGSSSRLGFFTGLQLPALDIYQKERLSIAFGGNIGVSETEPTQRLEVNGKLKIGNDEQLPSAGTVRWNTATNDFEGYDGAHWLSLTKSKHDGWGGIDMIQEDQGSTCPDNDGYRRVGFAISIEGNIAAIGSNVNSNYYNGASTQGKVYLFEYIENENVWQFLDTLKASDGYPDDSFGEAVSLGALYLVVGAPSADDFPDDQAGKVYIFKRYDYTSFVEEAILYGENQDDYYGTAVEANSSGHLIIGAPRHDSSPYFNNGKIYLYFIWGTGFTPYAELYETFNGTGPSSSEFGYHVDLSANYYAYASGINTNEIKTYQYMFQGSGYDYYPIGTIPNEEGPFDSYEDFGADNGWLIVGRPSEDVEGNTDQGMAHIYKRNGSTWSLSASLYGGDSAAGDLFGHSVAMYENYCVVGAPSADVNAVNNQGKAYVYYRTGDSWTQKAMLTASDGTVLDQFGFTVAITPAFVCVGAPFRENLSHQDQGGVYFFKK